MYLEDGQDVLAEEVIKLAADDEKLAAMAERSTAIARTDAADVIYDNLGIDR